MKFDKNKLTRSFYKITGKLQKHAPEILVVAGVIGTVTGTVLACKATTKAVDILDEVKDKLDGIKEIEERELAKLEDSENEEAVKYTEEDVKHATALVYTQAAGKLVKVYAPSIAIGTLSIISILAGTNILKKRNAAIAAAYAGLDKTFRGYRNRVIERFGEEIEKEIRYNIQNKEFETVIMDNDGNETVVKETVKVSALDGISPFARFYQEGCFGYTDCPEDNLKFLRAQQEFANLKLRSKGRLFLNEVYAMLNIPETKDGQTHGWIYDEKNPIGDNYVDFGLYNINRERTRDFVNGYEPVILLDFNIDGDILQYM